MRGTVNFTPRERRAILQDPPVVEIHNRRARGKNNIHEIRDQQIALLQHSV
jgi:hypothetical protein